MDCREAREHLSDLRDGSLPRTVAEGITRHLGGCADCAEVARSLDAVREGLRNLPPIAAPPELLARVREAVAREAAADGKPSRSIGSRLKIPLETAAALLLLASAYWYWGGSTPTTASRTPTPTPVQVASPAPKPVEVASPALQTEIPPAPVRVARTAPRAVPPPPSSERMEEQGSRSAERSIATLPEDTPDPKVRVYSLADLPTSPVLRASTRFRRIQPGARPESPAAEGDATPQPEAPAAEHHASNLRPPIPYGREVSVEVALEDREEEAERIGEAARRLGGAVEGTDRVVPDGTVAVRVLLPERTAKAFLEELRRNGKIPPEGMPARSLLPDGPTPGTIAYTVRLHAR